MKQRAIYIVDYELPRLGKEHFFEDPLQRLEREDTRWRLVYGSYLFPHEPYDGLLELNEPVPQYHTVHRPEAIQPGREIRFQGAWLLRDDALEIWDAYTKLEGASS
jgi:hypothetical protein